MLWSFLVAAAAGWLAPRAEGPLFAALERALGAPLALDATEKRVLAVLALLAAAAGIVALLGANSALFPAALGCAGGYFGARLYAFLRDPNGIDAVDAAARWDGTVREVRRRPGYSPAHEAVDPDDATLRAVSARLAGGVPSDAPPPPPIPDAPDTETRP